MSTSESIEDLVSQIQSGNSSGMSELYERVRKLIIKICNRYRAYNDPEDLEQESVLALYAAVDGYDPEVGVKFITYLSECIKNRILRYIGNNKSDVKIVSLDAPIISENDETYTLEDVISSGENMESHAVDSVYDAGMKAALWSEVDTLPDAESGIIRRCYRDGKTLREAADDTGLSYEKARGVRKRGLHALQKSKRLKNMLEDSEIFGAAIRGNGTRRFNDTWESSTERIALRLYEKSRSDNAGDNTGDDPEI